MLALLLGLRVAACPDPYFLADNTYVGTYNTLCDNGNDFDNFLGPSSTDTPTKEFLCSPATEQTPCCFSEYDAEHGEGYMHCVSRSAKPLEMSSLWQTWGKADAPEYVCNDTVNSAVYNPKNKRNHNNDVYLASVDCTSLLPAGNNDLSPGAVAGIVVGGVLGPFLLGGIYSYFS